MSLRMFGCASASLYGMGSIDCGVWSAYVWFNERVSTLPVRLHTHTHTPKDPSQKVYIKFRSDEGEGESNRLRERASHIPTHPHTHIRVAFAALENYASDAISGHNKCETRVCWRCIFECANMSTNLPVRPNCMRYTTLSPNSSTLPFSPRQAHG